MTRDPWIRLGFEAFALGLESSQVMGLRALKLAAGGPEAERESRRMVGEKVEALFALQTRALSGGLGLTAGSAIGRTLTHYRRKVRANRRRLTKG